MNGSEIDSRTGTLRFRDLMRRFDRAAESFDKADFVHRQTAAGLLARLAPMLLDARVIVDLGGATGSAHRPLRKRFRRSNPILVDASREMLRQAGKKAGWFSRRSRVQANAIAMPLKSGSVDLVFCNLLLPWIADAPALFKEIARVLKSGGLFLFSSLGPDSLSELRRAWAAVDPDQHVNDFADMHDVGDALVRAGLRDPVLDTDFLNVSYRDTDSLLRDLTQSGSRNSLAGRRKTLTGKRRFGSMLRQLEQRFTDGRLEIRLEIVYGHAWGGGPPRPAGEYVVDLARIGRRALP